MLPETQNMIKKQITAVIVAASLLAVLGVLYFTVIKPAIDEASAVVEETPETLDGEELGASNRFYMYSHLDRSEMASIEIMNETGSYKLVADGSGSFYIDGFQGIALDDSKVASLVATCGSPLSKTRVTADASAEKLAEYGLANPAACWIITDNNGKRYKVNVGRELLTGGGYYCSFAGRNSVYVLDTTLSETVLKPKEVFVTPYIVFGISKDDYYTVDDFSIFRGKDKFITVGKVPKEKQNSPDAIVEYTLTYPAPYYPDTETYANILLGFTSFTGDSTYKLGVTEKELAECGFDDPEYTVSFSYGGQKYYFFVTEADEDNYYVLSGIYTEIISKISKKSLSYLEKDLLSWLSPFVFRKNIDIVSTLKVESKNVDETFHLVNTKTDDGTAVLQVRSDSGREFVSSEESLNFRHYYSDMIALALTDYLPAEASEGVAMEDFLADESNRTMRITCVTTSGDEYVFDIYRYSTRRCAVSVNGRFDFCVLNDVVTRIESDTELLLAGKTVVGTY